MGFSEKHKGVSVSFEFFPPANLEKADRFWNSINYLAAMKPAFISITYGAGGTTRDRSLAIVERLLRDKSLNTAAHLTCCRASRAEVDELARRFHEAGVRRLVALRGDPPHGEGKFAAHPNGYGNATEFIHGLKRVADFDITVAAYPEKHPESPSLKHEFQVLKQKIDAGAKRAITQFFFDAEKYLRFMDKAGSQGIDIPIIPGLLPIVNFSRVQKLSKSCGAHIPAWLARLFDKVEPASPLNSMLAAAVLIDQCEALYDAGVRNFHFYTLNQSELVHAACHALGLR